MAKIAFNKLVPIKSMAPVMVTIGNMEIEVLQYLPAETKGNFIEELMMHVFDDTHIASPLRKQVYFNLLILKYYTNINLTDTMLINGPKTYDALYYNNVFEPILNAIPANELNILTTCVDASIMALTNYYQSVSGALADLNTEQNDTLKNFQKIMSDLQQNENFDVLRSTLESLS